MTKRWIGPAVIGGMLIFTALVYAGLPERIPTHWNLSGEVDGWSGRLWGSLLAPVIAAALWVLMPVLRRVDPRRSNYDRFDPTFWLIVNVIIVFMGAMHVLTLGMALGWAIDMTRAILVLVGLLFAGLGNYLSLLGERAVHQSRQQEAGKTPLLDLRVITSGQERAAVFALFAVVALEAMLNFSVPLYIQIIQGRGCLQCHSLDGSASTGPTFKDLFGRQEVLADGTVQVDDNDLAGEQTRRWIGAGLRPRS